MRSRTKRGWAAAATVVIAAAINIATGVVTQNWSNAAWAAVVALAVIGAGLQFWLTAGERAAVAQRVQNTKVDGSVKQTLPGAGEQSVTDSTVGKDLIQRQGPNGP